MPRRDGKGPRGEGPKTGRKLGRCFSKEDIEFPDRLEQEPMRLGRGQGLRSRFRGWFRRGNR